MRYKNPTPNPLPASEEGAMMYFIQVHTAILNSGGMRMNEGETVETKSVNMKLINTLIQVIHALSPEERHILTRELS
jgi:hypothetical protein